MDCKVAIPLSPMFKNTPLRTAGRQWEKTRFIKGQIMNLIAFFTIIYNNYNSNSVLSGPLATLSDAGRKLGMFGIPIYRKYRYWNSYRYIGMTFLVIPIYRCFSVYRKFRYIGIAEIHRYYRNLSVYRCYINYSILSLGKIVAISPQTLPWPRAWTWRSHVFKPSI